ncbi:nitroreductase family protein [Pseudidiomarina sp.]|uniref:nitroreductase family protein n=1 Tax=Pseudidiomarina sp. TaxID=2081707 RepID=UPI003A9830A6
MHALELLTQRSSMPRLIEPGPTSEQFDLMLKAAGRAPDHMALMPYEFIVYDGSNRQQLGQVFQRAAANKGVAEAQVVQASQLPLRAPLVIAVAMKYQPHDKVPRDEQLASAACTALLMQQAAFAQGLGAIWRTGWFAEDEQVKAELGLSPDDAIVGFLYVGTPAVPTPIKPDKDIQSKVRFPE